LLCGRQSHTPTFPLASCSEPKTTWTVDVRGGLDVGVTQQFLLHFT